MLVGRGHRRGKVVMGFLLTMVLVALTDGTEEGESQDLPRPNVIRGEIVKIFTRTHLV